MKSATVVLLLVGSNAFMTIAWYGHLKYKHVALWMTVLAAWLIALPEYALQVPANRIGYGQFTATQAEGDPGSHFAERVRGVRLLLFEGSTDVANGAGFRADHCRGDARPRRELTWRARFRSRDREGAVEDRSLTVAALLNSRSPELFE